MSTRNNRIRFAAENQVTSSNISSTTANASFPLSNLTNDFRYKVFKPTSMTAQRITIDLGWIGYVGFVALIGQLDEPFPISQGATFKIQANNVEDWTSPPLDLAMTWGGLGGFRFLDDQADSSYKYWSFYFDDPQNEIGSFSHIYVGEYQTLTFSNVTRGFQHTHIDPSVAQESDSGALFFRDRAKYKKFDNVGINYLTKSDYDQFEQIVFNQGKTRPFYVSFDPLLEISADLTELTRFVRFDREPVFIHQKVDRYSFTGISFREVE